MSKKKLPKDATPITGLDEMEECIRTMCLLAIKEDELIAARDAELARVRDQYGAELKRVKDRSKQKFDLAHDWAVNHPEEFPSKKSIAFVHGTIGFRTGTPSLKTLRGFTWAKVLDIVRERFPQFMRTKEEVDREAILRHADKLGARIKEIGVRVVREETFYFEPARDAVEK